MSRVRTMLAIALVLLFAGLSFNAYACLLPLNGTTVDAMGKDCTTPDAQPIYQFCDAFKTLSVQSSDTLLLSGDCQALCPEDTSSLVLLEILAAHRHRLSDHPPDGPLQDLLLKISVLRI